MSCCSVPVSCASCALAEGGNAVPQSAVETPTLYDPATVKQWYDQTTFNLLVDYYTEIPGSESSPLTGTDNRCFDELHATTFPPGHDAVVPDCSSVPFDGTAEGVPKKGCFSGTSRKTDEITRRG